MPSPNDTVSMALFCDFENVALGVRDAKYEKFDIKLVLERLLLKGSIVVKKAYCDWDRYKSFKGAMHEASFEMIEIPHVRQSGKNSADIRLVVDALDLCYTKSHVNTFVIISGDSDFSPLVSKLRENAKQVIGIGVKQSTSDLLIANCDEFIFYDDLVRESQRATASTRRDNPRNTQAAASPGKRPADEAKPVEREPKEDLETRKQKALEIAVQTFDALASERGDSGKIWASVLKNAIKRRKPDFNESYYGFRAFGNLLEEAQARGMLEFGRDEKSGAYVYRSAQGVAVSENIESVNVDESSRDMQPRRDGQDKNGNRAKRDNAQKQDKPNDKRDRTKHARGGKRDDARRADEQRERATGGRDEFALDAASEAHPVAHEASYEESDSTTNDASRDVEPVELAAPPEPPAREPSYDLFREHDELTVEGPSVEPGGALVVGEPVAASDARRSRRGGARKSAARKTAKARDAQGNEAGNHTGDGGERVNVAEESRRSNARPSQQTPALQSVDAPPGATASVDSPPVELGPTSGSTSDQALTDASTGSTARPTAKTAAKKRASARPARQSPGGSGNSSGNSSGSSSGSAGGTRRPAAKRGGGKSKASGETGGSGEA